jgi:ATP-dependent RNA helicase DDX10/DBP4
LRIATSRKALAKKGERGTKLKFDDDGVAHTVYDLVTEEEFKEQGNPEDMKRRFVEETAARLKVVDEDDLEEFKEKRKMKKLKREGRLDAE